jgi:hypothetical protein
MTGNFLTDILGIDYQVNEIDAFNAYFKYALRIPMLDLNAPEDYNKALFVIDSYGEKKLIKSIYNELGYPLNRGPIYYVSNYVLNYGFETYIIITQDGMLCQNPNSNKEVAFYAWDNWKEVLYTKHKDLESPVLLLAYPENNHTIEMSISPKLDLHKNIILDYQAGQHKASYTEVLLKEMNFARLLFKHLWEIVDENRNSDINNIPLDKLLIYNDANSLKSFIDN